MKVALVMAAALAVGQCQALYHEPQIDYGRSPGIVYGCGATRIGDVKAFGWTPPEAVAMREVLAVDFLDVRGGRIVGYGLHSLGDQPLVGCDHGWPPAGYSIEGMSKRPGERAASDPVAVSFGLEQLAEFAGVRGLRVVYVDGSGRTITETVDWGYLMCPSTCGGDSALRRLGLMT